MASSLFFGQSSSGLVNELPFYEKKQLVSIRIEVHHYRFKAILLPAVWCSLSLSLSLYIYIYIYMYVCVWRILWYTFFFLVCAIRLYLFNLNRLTWNISLFNIYIYIYNKWIIRDYKIYFIYIYTLAYTYFCRMLLVFWDVKKIRLICVSMS